MKELALLDVHIKMLEDDLTTLLHAKRVIERQLSIDPVNVKQSEAVLQQHGFNGQRRRIWQRRPGYIPASGKVMSRAGEVRLMLQTQSHITVRDAARQLNCSLTAARNILQRFIKQNLVISSYEESAKKVRRYNWIGPTTPIEQDDKNPG